MITTAAARNTAATAATREFREILEAHSARRAAAQCGACEGRAGSGIPSQGTWEKCPVCDGSGFKEEFVTRFDTHIRVSY